MRREMDHGGQPLEAKRAQSRRQRAGELAAHHAGPEQHGIGEHARQQAAHHPVGDRAPVGLFDMHPGLIGQVHVVHA